MPSRGHKPERTCVACGSKRPKSELLRINRTDGGTVEIDESGRRDGRGTYICPQAGHAAADNLCFRIARALRLEHGVPQEFLADLRDRLEQS